MHINRFATSAAALLFLAFASPAAADDTILSITGNVTAGAEVHFNYSRSAWQVRSIDIE